MVGRYLMRELAARGALPIAVVRSPNKALSLAALGYETRTAHLHDAEALTKAFAGLDAVISPTPHSTPSEGRNQLTF